MYKAYIASLGQKDSWIGFKVLRPGGEDADALAKGDDGGSDEELCLFSEVIPEDNGHLQEEDQEAERSRVPRTRQVIVHLKEVFLVCSLSHGYFAQDRKAQEAPWRSRKRWWPAPPQDQL